MRKLLLLLLLCSDLALAAKILKNNTGSPVPITDTGVIVPASGQYTILPTEDFVFAASDDTIILIGDSTLTVSDGTNDLGIAEGTSLIQGFFPKRMQITGGDELRNVDVILDGGLNKIPVIADINIVSTDPKGRDPNPDSWCRVDTAGDIGDTITISIPDDSCTVVSTATATEAGDPVAFAELMAADFNADGTCRALYIATQVKDNPVVVYSAIKIDGIAERPDAGDFNCDATGTTTVFEFEDVLISREKLIKVVPDPDDPRVGATNITGNIFTVPKTINDTFEIHAENGGSENLNVDGSVTPVDFIISCDATRDQFYTELRIFGTDNGIKFGQYYAINSPLTNGTLVTIRSNNAPVIFTVDPLTETDDLQNHFARPITNFMFHIQAGRDLVTAGRVFENPFVVKKCGSFATDDEIRVSIQDDLTSMLSHQFIGIGFFKE